MLDRGQYRAWRMIDVDPPTRGRHAHCQWPHELILVPVRACQGTNVRKDILQGVSQLEGIDIAETELNVSIDN
jgi:hypothetical protein